MFSKRLPLIVAEIGASHGGFIDNALTLVDQAAEAGADAVKLQTWSRMTVDKRPISGGAWNGIALTRLYAATRTPPEWHAEIFARAARRSLIAFSTPFDPESVEFLEKLDCPMYKIASFEITYLDLIATAAATGKPLIMSTGMATEEEIDTAMQTALRAGAKQENITLLHCISAYPAPAGDFNLRTMQDMAKRHWVDVGLSDHSRGTAIAVAATALGATVIEKHIGIRGVDSHDEGFAADFIHFRRMVAQCREAAESLGQVAYGPAASEMDSLFFRRSLWVTSDMSVGDHFLPSNVAILRPQGGLPPPAYEYVTAGRRARCDILAGTPLTDDLLDA